MSAARATLQAAIGELSEEAFAHLAVVCHDIARRLPDDAGFAAVGVAARAHLGIPEPVAPVVEPPAAPADGDVTVPVAGVSAASEVGGLG